MSDEKAKILLWDIETRGLVGDYGSIFCIGWKFLGDKDAQVASIHDFPGKHILDDRELVRWFVKNVWNEADIAVGWYSSGHDEPFLRTRMLIHCDPAPKPVTTLDLWGKVYKRFKFSRNSLDNVARHLGIGPKFYGPKDDFEKVLYGDVNAMKRIVKHCKVDVEITEKAYNKFAPYINAHPRVSFVGSECRVCGGARLERRGWKFSAAKGKAIQVRCKDCNSWDTKLPGELEKKEKKET